MYIINYGVLIVRFFYMCSLWTCFAILYFCFLWLSDIEGYVMGVMFSWQDLEVLKRSNSSRAIEAAKIRVISCFSQEVMLGFSKNQRKEKTCYHRITIVIQQVLIMWPSGNNPDIICLNIMVSLDPPHEVLCCLLHCLDSWNNTVLHLYLFYSLSTFNICKCILLIPEIASLIELKHHLLPRMLTGRWPQWTWTSSLTALIRVTS